MEKYFITYKKVTIEYPQIYEYWDILSDLKKKFINLVHFWETDSQNRLHLHCIGEARKNLYIQRFSRKGYTFKIEVVHDEPKLLCYLNKQTHNTIEQEQLLDSYNATVNYLFSNPPAPLLGRHPDFTAIHIDH